MTGTTVERDVNDVMLMGPAGPVGAASFTNKDGSPTKDVGEVITVFADIVQKAGGSTMHGVCTVHPDGKPGLVVALTGNSESSQLNAELIGHLLNQRAGLVAVADIGLERLKTLAVIAQEAVRHVRELERHDVHGADEGVLVDELARLAPDDQIDLLLTQIVECLDAALLASTRYRGVGAVPQTGSTGPCGPGDPTAQNDGGQDETPDLDPVN